MDVTDIKVLAGFLLFAVAVVCGWTPYWCFTCCFRRQGLQRSGKGHILFVQCLHSMASGVLIATCLLHLLPESLETVREGMSLKHSQHGKLLESNTTTQTNASLVDMQSSGDGQVDEDTYPFGELLIAFGFMCVFMVDSGIRSCSESKNRSSSEAIDYDASFLLAGQTDLNQNLAVQETEVGSHVKGSGQTNSHWIHWIRSKLSKSETSYGPIQQRDVDSETDIANHNYIDATMVENENESGSTSDTTAPLSMTEVHPPASARQRHERSKSTHLRSAALVGALCIHGFFDGLMLGLQTSMPVLISLLFAISLHKSFVAAGLSFNFLGRGTKDHSALRIMLLVLLFAASSPLGVLVSSVFMHEAVGVSSDQNTNIVSGCLQSFAVGTFMYVTFSGTAERHHQRSLSADVINHVFLLVGFSVMAGLRAAVGSS